jgi:carbonic anhydrase/acetyltransferase-like protein (isoleucine patch superfamily)
MIQVEMLIGDGSVTTLIGDGSVLYTRSMIGDGSVTTLIGDGSVLYTRSMIGDGSVTTRHGACIRHAKEYVHSTHLRAVEKSLCACCEGLGKDNDLCRAGSFDRGDS